MAMMIISAMGTISRTPALYRYLGDGLRGLLCGVSPEGLEEVRVRAGKPVVLHYGDKMAFLDRRGGVCADPAEAYQAQKSDVEECVEKLCRGSVYAFLDEMKNGYITTAEGDRVGISGTLVTDGDEIVNVRDIAGLNFRIAREVIGAADLLMPYLIRESELKSTLVISAPQLGKTTLLRDAARQLGQKYKVAVVDERNEIAAMSGGVSHYDLGIHTEVLAGCPKDRGIFMALRSLSPQVIITDELGGDRDLEAVRRALNCGVSVLASMHAGSIAQLARKKEAREIRELFDAVACLTIQEGQRVLGEVTAK